MLPCVNVSLTNGVLRATCIFTCHSFIAGTHHSRMSTMKGAHVGFNNAATASEFPPQNVRFPLRATFGFRRSLRSKNTGWNRYLAFDGGIIHSPSPAKHDGRHNRKRVAIDTETILMPSKQCFGSVIQQINVSHSGVFGQ
eukprot:GEMP01119384.1.p1 GENE.GEMP01119384.1~~GEMP01119384.1.p1  ORF type:complete len:140 (-),score=15.24 GEMP01119384.1:144-563(-)